MFSIFSIFASLTSVIRQETKQAGRLAHLLGNPAVPKNLSEGLDGTPSHLGRSEPSVGFGCLGMLFCAASHMLPCYCNE